MTSDQGALHAGIWAQYERLCNNQVLAAATQLKVILGFLVEGFVNNRSRSQKEILAELLRKGAIDDRGKENEDLYLLVRLAIGTLRKRIAKYYAENPEDSFVIDIPSGKALHGYRLSVHPREASASADSRNLSRYASIYQKQLKEHWKPVAMGSGSLFQGGHWYFSGRTEVLRSIVQWLSEPASGGMARVVTGDPGAGKSAVLGYLVISSDSDEIPDDPSLAAFLKTMPPGTVPRSGCVNFAINLRDRTLDQTLDTLADYLQSDRDEVLKVLANREENTVLVFDALEDASEPLRIAKELLRPLTGYERLWILIGARRPELPRLGESVVPLDLNSEQYQSDSDITLYVERLLLADNEIRNSPYRNHVVAAKRLAEALANAARGNFLIAFILARALIERHHVSGPLSVFDPGSIRTQRTTEEAFSEYLLRLGERSGLGFGRVRRAFIPLAYAQGEGMPREVWALLTSEDVAGLLHLASAFVSEYHEDGRLVYRLYHRALAEALQRSEHESEEHRVISECLINAVPEKDWNRAHWYTQKYLVGHAAHCSMLDVLLLDTSFLAVAGQAQLLDVIDQASTNEASRRASWYRIAASRFGDAGVSERLSYLELVALEHGAPDLAVSTQNGADRPWRTRWARFAAPTPHLAIHAYVNDVKLVALNDNVVASASEGMYPKVNLWDLRSGRQLFVFEHRLETVTALAINDQVVTWATTDGVRVWNLERNEFVSGFAIEQVEAVAITGDHLVIAKKGGVVEVLNWRTGDFFELPQQAYAGGDGCTAVYGDILVCGSAEEGVIRQWNLATGEKLSEYKCGVQNAPDLLAIGKDIALSANGYSIRSTNLKTGLTFHGPEIKVPTCLAIADVGAIGDVEGRIHFWRPETGTLTHACFTGHQAALVCLAVAQHKVASGGRDGFVRIWNKSGFQVGQPTPLASDNSLYGNFVNCIALLGTTLIAPPDIEPKEYFVPDGLIIIGRGDGTTTLLDQETGELWGEVPTSDRAPTGWTLSESPINLADQRAEGESVDDSSYLLDDSTGQLWKIVPEYGTDWTKTEVCSVAASDDLIVSGFHWGTMVWSRKTGQALDVPLRLLDENIKTIANGHGFFVTLNQSGKVHLWNSRTGISVGDIRDWHDREVQFVTTIDDIVVCGTSKGEICFWDTKREISLPQQIVHAPLVLEDSQVFHNITALACSGDIVASMLSTGDVYVWSRQTGTLLIQPNVSSLFVDNPRLVQDVAAGTRTRRPHVSRALAASQKWLVYSIGFVVDVWDVVARRSILRIRLSSPVNALAIKGPSIFVACLDGAFRFDLP